MGHQAAAQLPRICLARSDNPVLRIRRNQRPGRACTCRYQARSVLPRSRGRTL